MIHNECPIDISWINPPITPAYTHLVIGKDENGFHRSIRAYFDNGVFVFGIEFMGERFVEFDEYRSMIIKEAKEFHINQ